MSWPGIPPEGPASGLTISIELEKMGSSVILEKTGSSVVLGDSIIVIDMLWFENEDKLKGCRVVVGTNDGMLEGMIEGMFEVMIEDIIEGAIEGAIEGRDEASVESVIERLAENTFDGTTEDENRGLVELEIMDGMVEGM